MEGVAYALRDSLTIIQDMGVPVKRIIASGGGAKSPLWRQMQADIFGQPASIINAEQGPAYGAGLLAAVGAGAFKSVEEACAATIKVVDETPPNKVAKKAYDARFPVYQDLYRALKNDFKQIAQLG